MKQLVNNFLFISIMKKKFFLQQSRVLIPTMLEISSERNHSEILNHSAMDLEIDPMTFYACHPQGGLFLLLVQGE